MKPRFLLTDTSVRHQLRGRWFDADQPTEELEDQIADFLMRSPSPRPTYTVTAYAGFGGLELGPQPAWSDVTFHARMVVEHDHAWVAYVRLTGTMLADEEDFLHRYRGIYGSPMAYAAAVVEGGYDPESMGDFDLKQFLGSLVANGYRFVPDGQNKVFVFSGPATSSRPPEDDGSGG